MLGAKPKILFAPHEIGGQMQVMVEELRSRGYYATAVNYNQEWFGHVNDVNLEISKVPSKVGRHVTLALFTAWAVRNYDIFHFFWGSSLYGFGPLPHLDLPLLRRLKKKIYVHFRGLDIIDLKYFDYLRAQTAGDHVDEPPMTRPDQLKRIAYWRRYADKMLVSEPDLLWVVPEATMVQQAIKLDYWKPTRKETAGDDGIVRIAHAPSMRRKKGTEFVERTIAELKAEGLPVELVLIEKVPFDQVKTLYESCDIGIDQVLYGWYGKVSIELMALGKPVICYINDELVKYRDDMPIVNANPNNLTDQVRGLVNDRQLRQALGLQGIEYVTKHHDVKAIIDQCVGLYGIDN